MQYMRSKGFLVGSGFRCYLGLGCLHIINSPLLSLSVTLSSQSIWKTLVTCVSLLVCHPIVSIDMEDFGDLRFHLIPLDIVKPGDDSMAGDKFCIEVEASFMPPILDEDDLDEYESQLFDLEWEWKEEDFLVDRDRLLNDDQETSRSIIRDILGDLNIPIRAFMIDSILACARQMAVDNVFLSRKVLYMRVRIDVPPGFESSDDDIIGGELNLVPATKSSIEALEIVKVEEGYAKQPCAVCFEELLIGGEAIRLPCSHVYHCGCIRKWLEKSKFCPLCRFEIS